MFILEDKVFIKQSRRKGVVKEVGEGNYKVTYYDESGKRRTEWFDVSELTGWRVPKGKYNQLEIKVKYHTDIPEIEQIDIGNWIDLRASEDVELKQFDYYAIPLGVSMQLPKGYEAEVKPRSSTFKVWGILQTNSVGAIDESYCGDNDIWKMPVIAMRDTKINKGDRICQFRIQRIMPKLKITTVETLGNENRGGLGHTGTN